MKDKTSWKAVERPQDCPVVSKPTETINLVVVSMIILGICSNPSMDPTWTKPKLFQESQGPSWSGHHLPSSLFHFLFPLTTDWARCTCVSQGLSPPWGVCVCCCPFLDCSSSTPHRNPFHLTVLYSPAQPTPSRIWYFPTQLSMLLS
jgi:hypothetical protein